MRAAISSVTLKSVYKKHERADFVLKVDDLEFDNRAIHVITGANGSGKSTLLKLIALLDRPDSGAILFNGPRGGRHDTLRKRIGFVMQNPYLFRGSASENIALGLRIRGWTRSAIAPKVNGMMNRLNISNLAGRRVRDLSGGERQKIAVAQILILEPEVILMDEPAANIDSESTLSIEEAVKDIQARCDSIVIMTTHSLTQGYRMSRNIISIKAGRIADCQTPSLRGAGALHEATKQSIELDRLLRRPACKARPPRNDRCEWRV